MSNAPKSAGYIITDRNQDVIYGYGSTVDEAWTMVVDGVRTFVSACGNEIAPDEAYETQFKTFPATADLLTFIEDHGGNICWDKIAGIACTVAEFNAGE